MIDKIFVNISSPAIHIITVYGETKKFSEAFFVTKVARYPEIHEASSYSDKGLTLGHPFQIRYGG